MKTMKTWQGFANNVGAAVTTWNYHPQRGWLANKRYQDNTGPAYTYTPGGRLKTRAWARGITTTYTNNLAGELWTIAYSDGTPGVTYTYDRLGRQLSAVQGTVTVAYRRNFAGQLLGEKYTGGPLNGLTVTNRYDQLLRRTNVATLNASLASLSSVGYGYDAASRLALVRSTNVSIGYSYLANSPLFEQVSYTNNTTRQMTTTRAYDNLNRLTSVASAGQAGSSLTSFDYDYNTANQRTVRREADGCYWRYEYDTLGQVKSGKKYWSDGTPVAGQQFEYGFDDIGNRTGTKAGGDESGAGLRPANYSANLLNQYTNRTVPGAVDIMGVSFATNTVTVNEQAAYRKGEYFRKELAVANSTAPVWQSITVAATGQTNVTGNTFVPKTPEAFGYDLDGNLTNDGRWRFTWDAENRLVRMVSGTAVGPQQRIDFDYDHQSRRITKKVWNNTAGSGTPVLDIRFLYDGWNLAAELNATNNAVIRSFSWGNDLSGSMQGAGGVGGLLAITTPSAGVHFTCFDGNGNVTALVNSTDGQVAARYEYGPFGEVLRATGPMAKANPLRFSTKYQDDETDLVCYLHRYYNPSTGKWLNRDPIAERGGLNLYAAMRNNPVQHIDPLGLDVTVQTPAEKEWSDLGCGDCPAKAVEDRRNQANQNIIVLINWAASGKCRSIKDYANLVKNNTLATAGKGGYRSPELKKMPACIKNAVNWIESQNVLTAVSMFNTVNLGLNPFSDTPWCCFGNALAADEANRQKWLYQRLGVVQSRCEELKKQLPPSATQ